MFLLFSLHENESNYRNYFDVIQNILELCNSLIMHSFQIPTFYSYGKTLK